MPTLEMQQSHIAAGTPWATAYTVNHTKVPGPTVVIVAGIHGNEPAGVTAASQIATWPIICGKLVVLPRANVSALTANKRLIPNAIKSEADLNRNFTNIGPQGYPAITLWKWLKSQSPQWLLDLHEGVGIHSMDSSKSVGSSIIICPDNETKAVAHSMIAAVNRSINADQQFVILSPPVEGSLARAAGDKLCVRSMILETSRTLPVDLRVHQHRTMVAVLLSHLEMI